MKERWQQLCDKSAKLEMQEKLIMFGGVQFLLLYLAITMFIWPAYEKIQTAKEQIISEQRQLQTTEQQIEIYADALKKDPDDEVRQSIQSIQQSIDDLEHNLDALTADFISPAKMQELLLALLSDEDNIRVMNFGTTGSKAMDIAGIPQNSGITLYQHGLKLSVSGSYFDLQRYMQRLESLPWRFYWNVFSYKVTEYPLAQLDIEITTISNNERFIGI